MPVRGYCSGPYIVSSISHLQITTLLSSKHLKDSVNITFLVMYICISFTVGYFLPGLPKIWQRHALQIIA